MFQVSPKGTVTIYSADPKKHENATRKVEQFIEKLCGRPMRFSLHKLDTIRNQYYRDTYVDLTRYTNKEDQLA